MEMKNVATMEVEIKESGPQGEPGPRGLSAYEVYLENGGNLSETDWLESLKGETGKDGNNGKDGLDGKDGYTPVKGEDYFTEGDIATLGIPHKISELENDSNFITSEYVDDSIANIDIPECAGAEATEIFLLKMPRCEYANSLFSANHSKMTDEIKQSILYVIDAFTKKGILYPCIKLTGEYLVGSGGGTGAIFKATSPCQPPTSSGVYSYSFEAIGSTRGSTSNGVPLLQIEIVALYDSTTQTWSEPDPTYYTMLRHRVNSEIQFATSGYLNNWYLSRGNTTAFTPTGDYNPATKKYVDDSIANIDIPEGGGGTSYYIEQYSTVDLVVNGFSNEYSLSLDNKNRDIIAGYIPQLLEDYRNGKLTPIIFILKSGLNNCWQIPLQLLDSKTANDRNEYIFTGLHTISQNKIHYYKLRLVGSWADNVYKASNAYFTVQNLNLDKMATKTYVDDAIKAAITTVLEAEY